MPFYPSLVERLKCYAGALSNAAGKRASQQGEFGATAIKNSIWLNPSLRRFQ